MANLRILYNNIADAATIVATSTDTLYPTSNLKKDAKGLVWRSTLLTDTLSLSGLVGGFNCVILAFTNTTSGSVNGISISAPGTNEVNLVNGIFKYSLGNTIYARCYMPNTSTSTLDITVTSTSQVEVSRLIVGTYWSPKINLSLGYNLGIKDSSETSRTFGGNSTTGKGTKYKTLEFSLPYMQVPDVEEFQKIQRSNKAMFISLFPEDTDGDKEQMYQIYGRLSSLASISHPMYTQFTSSISIEEI